MNREPELLKRDRNLIALLDDAGIRAGTKAALVWRLREVDGLTEAAISAQVGIQPASVARYCRAVDRRLYLHLHPGEAVPAALEGLETDEDEERPDPLLQEARDLRDCHANRQEGADPPGFAAPCDPIVSAWDVKQMLLGLAVPWLPVVPTRGGGRRWRDFVR